MVRPAARHPVTQNSSRAEDDLRVLDALKLVKPVMAGHSIAGDECRATLIMSPCGDIRNVPFYNVTALKSNLKASTGGQIGKGSDER